MLNSSRYIPVHEQECVQEEAFSYATTNEQRDTRSRVISASLLLSLLANVVFFSGFGTHDSSLFVSEPTSLSNNNGIAPSTTTCDIEGRKRQQLCGAGMLKNPWNEDRTSAPTALIPDPTCPRSSSWMPTPVAQNKDAEMKLTFAILYYEEPNYLSHQINEWLSWSKETRNKFHFLVVDDGSRVGLRASDLLLPHKDILQSQLKLEVFHIEQDLCWNIGGARNLAVHVMPTEYFYLGDSDLLVEDDLAQYMLETAANMETEFRHSGTRTHAYKFSRTWIGSDKFKPHPAVYISSKSTHWYNGGCDEDLFFTSGKYRDRAKKSGINIVMLEEEMESRGIPPLRAFSSDKIVPCHDMMMSNCPAMVRFKEQNHVVRPSKPDAEDEDRYWTMKLKGQKPYANDYLRFSWTKSYP